MEEIIYWKMLCILLIIFILMFLTEYFKQQEKLNWFKNRFQNIMQFPL